MSWVISSCYQTSLDRTDKDTVSRFSYQLFHDHGGQKKHIPFTIRKRAESSFDVITFSRCPCSSWVAMLLSRTWCGIFRWHLVTELRIHCWMWSQQLHHTAFVVIWESALMRKKANWDKTKWWLPQKRQNIARCILNIVSSLILTLPMICNRCAAKQPQ